ncbi:MAG: four helix bundle protein [Verrucomicrobiota bacterium]
MPIESYRDREEFLQFLRRANGSLVEVETRLVLSADLEFSNQQEVGGMSKQRQNLGK